MANIAGALGLAEGNGRMNDKCILITKRGLRLVKIIYGEWNDVQLTDTKGDSRDKEKLGLPPLWLRFKLSTLSPRGPSARITATTFDQKKTGGFLTGGKKGGDITRRISSSK